MSIRDLALRALVVKHIADVTAAAIKERRSELGDEMANGDRIGVSSPDDPAVEIGLVYRTKPKGTTEITDPARFTGWMLTHYPDRVQAVRTIADKDMGVAVKVLQEHAPDLVTSMPVVMPWAVSEVLKLTEQARQPCGPGGEVDVPGVDYEPPRPGVVAVKLSEGGPAAVEQLWRDGRINLRSGEVRALPEGNPA